MAVSKYDKKKLTEEQQNQIKALTASAERGVMGWDDAHSRAEAIRASADYSGGADGSEYIPLSGREGAIPFQSTAAEREAAAGRSSAPAGFDASKYTAGAPTDNGSRWDEKLAEAAGELVKMNYADWTRGDSYKALAERYSKEGIRAMQDVLGQISARTGGLASSYAASAAQQQQNNYMAKLEEAARQMYDSDRSELMENAGLLRTLQSDEYARYLDRLNQFNTDRSLAYTAGRDALSDARYDEETAYSRLRDALADTRYDQQYADSRADTAWSQNLTERQYADSRADELYNRAKEASAPRLDLDTALSMYASGVQSSEVMKTLQHNLGDNADAASLDAAAALKSADAEAEKPSLTWEQMNEVLPDERLRNTEGVRKSYDIYYGPGSYAEHYGEPEDNKIQGFKAHAAVFLQKQGNAYAHAYLSNLVANNRLSWEDADAIAEELGITEIDER